MFPFGISLQTHPRHFTALTAALPKGGRPELLRPSSGGDSAAAAQRQSWSLVEGQSQLVIRLEKGLVELADRRSEYCELHIAGPARSVWAWARQLDQVAPLHLAVQTRSERVQALAAAYDQSSKADAVELGLALDVAGAFRQILWSCIRHYRLNEDSLLRVYNPESLHQARVALRRLRTALSVFQPAFGAVPDELGDGLKALAQDLGHARDLDVLCDNLLPLTLPGPLLRMRDAARAEAMFRLQAASTRALFLDLTLWLQSGDWLNDPATLPARGQSARDFAALALGRYRRRVKSKGRRLTHCDDASRHELRKDAKKLRYATEFFAGLFPEPMAVQGRRKFQSRLTELLEVLGQLQDSVTARTLIHDLKLPAEVRLRLAARHDAGPRDAARAHKRLMRADRFWKG